MKFIALWAFIAITIAGCKPRPQSTELKGLLGDFPSEGRSRFDFAVAAAPGAEVPYPFSKLIAHLGGAQESVLVPVGRSLQKAAALPEPFTDPRRLVAVGDHTFLGYVKQSNQIEVISFNDDMGRFEFQVVEDYDGESTPKVYYANRVFCATCHQNESPLFIEAPWSEFNGSSLMAGMIQRHLPAKSESVDSINVYQTAANAGDRSYGFEGRVIRAANRLTQQGVWQSMCPNHLMACRYHLVRHAIFLYLGTDLGAFRVNGEFPSVGVPEIPILLSNRNILLSTMMDYALRHSLDLVKGYSLSELSAPGFGLLYNALLPPSLDSADRSAPPQPLSDDEAAEIIASLVVKSDSKVWPFARTPKVNDDLDIKRSNMKFELAVAREIVSKAVGDRFVINDETLGALESYYTRKALQLGPDHDPKVPRPAEEMTVPIDSNIRMVSRSFPDSVRRQLLDRLKLRNVENRANFEILSISIKGLDFQNILRAASDVKDVQVSGDIRAFDANFRHSHDWRESILLGNVPMSCRKHADAEFILCQNAGEYRALDGFQGDRLGVPFRGLQLALPVKVDQPTQTLSSVVVGDGPLKGGHQFQCMLEREDIAHDGVQGGYAEFSCLNLDIRLLDEVLDGMASDQTSEFFRGLDSPVLRPYQFFEALLRQLNVPLPVNPHWTDLNVALPKPQEQQQTGSRAMGILLDSCGGCHRASRSSDTEEIAASSFFLSPTKREDLCRSIEKWAEPMVRALEQGHGPDSYMPPSHAPENRKFTLDMRKSLVTALKQSRVCDEL